MEKLEQTIRVRNAGHSTPACTARISCMKYLMEADRNDLVFEMTNTTDYPGWGYMLANGATTSWESWTGQSHIHDTLISIGAWFTQGVAGIRSDEVVARLQALCDQAGGGRRPHIRSGQLSFDSRRDRQRLAD